MSSENHLHIINTCHMQVEKHFKPDLINRLSEIVIFEPLSRNELREIVKVQIKSIVAMMANKGFSLSVTEAAVEVILSESDDTVSMSSYDHQMR